MSNRRTLKRLCFLGIIMASTGVTSFSNHSTIGSIVALTGAVMVISIKVILWRGRGKTNHSAL